jgi:hypothetical protein
MEPPSEPPRSLEELQHDAAELDVKLKQLELQQKSRLGYGLIWNPVFVTAVVTILVTLATGISSCIVTTQQRTADDTRYKQETKKTILLGVINPSDPHSIAAKLKLFLDTKLIDDPDNSFHEAEQDLERQLPRSILLNILRASVYEPLEFSSKAAENSYSDVLQPIGFDELNYFIRGGYPRELLFRLFLDYVSFKPRADVDPQGRRAYIIYNDPSPNKQCIRLSEVVIAEIYPPEWRARVPREICYGDVVEFGLLSGLSSEIRNVAVPTIPSSTATVSTSTSTTEARLCFDGRLANSAIMEFAKKPPPEWIADGRDIEKFLTAVRLAEYHPVCGETIGLDRWLGVPTATAAPPVPSPVPAPAVPANPAPAVEPAAVAAVLKLNPSVGVQTLMVLMHTADDTPIGAPIWDINLLAQQTIEIGTRSAYSIYNFLGQLAANPETSANLLTRSQDEDPDIHILTVNKGQRTGCFAYASFDDDVYCVPSKGVENTKRIFSLLAQLPAQ